MRIRVNVTKELIQQGEPRGANCCPVALSLKSRFKDIEVRSESFKVTDQQGRRIEGQLTGVARGFIKKFDTSRKVQPFSTVLTGRVTFNPNADTLGTPAPAQA